MGKKWKKLWLLKKREASPQTEEATPEASKVTTKKTFWTKKKTTTKKSSNKTTKENLSFFDDILKLTDTSDRPLIIFPQGTRLLPQDRAPFKKGSSRIYEELKISCQPIAINSGFIWPKVGKKKPNKTLTVSILKSIEPGYEKNLFLEKLENNIYSELDSLN